jgi:hypothetical protein
MTALARVALRSGALARAAPALGRPSALAARAASSVAHLDTSGRTPERTAELERLAEEHNGFLFGEVVRLAPARRDQRAADAQRKGARPPPTTLTTPPRRPPARSRSPTASAGNGTNGSTSTIRSRCRRR